MRMKLEVYLFSFNRGRFLRNCVDSVHRNLPGHPLTVVDDHSNEPETRRVLQEVEAAGIPILQPPETGGKGRYGGLYANMQRAYESAPEGSWILFIQDDTQMVRPVEADDLEYIRSYFESFPKAAFLGPQFLRGERRRGISESLRADPGFPVYFYHFPERWKDRSVAMAYTDIFIGHSDRMRRAGWSFGAGESACAVRARQLFGKMGLMAHPINMYLPCVPTYHGKKKTRAMERAEQILGREPRPFRDLDPQQVARMKARPLSDLPYAESFLECLGPEVKRPFRYKAVNAFPLLRLQHKLEVLWGRLLSRSDRRPRLG